MNDMKTTGQRLAKDAVLLTVSKVAAKSSILLLFVLLSYLLSTGEYGNFRQVWMINRSLMEIFAFGIPLSIFYFLPRLLTGQRSVFIIQSLLMLLLLAVLFATLVFVFSENIAIFFNNADLARLLKIFSLYPLFALPAMALESILVALNKAKTFAIYTLADRFVFLVLTGTIVIVTRSLEILLIVTVAYSVIELAVGLAIIRFSLEEKKSASSRFAFGRQLRFALPSGISNLVAVLNQEIDKLMIAYFYTVSRFAVYANGGFEVPFIGTIASSVTSVMMPEYARRHQAGDNVSIIQLWHGAVCKVGSILIPLAVFLFIFAQDVITLLFSNKYIESTLIFQIYLIALLPKVTWYGPILVSMGYNKVPLYGAILAVISNVILNFWLIKLMGFPGPAVATVLTTYILTSYYLYEIMRATGVDWSGVFPWKNLLKMLLSAVVIGILVSPLAHVETIPSLVRLSTGFMAFSVCIFFIYRHLQIITKDDSDFFLSWASKIRNDRRRK